MMPQPNAKNKCVEMRSKSVQAGSSVISTICKNPMEIDTVVTHLFGFLNIKDLKKCRLVSSQWSRIGKEALIKKARILIDDTTGDTTHFLDTFLASVTKGKFSAFKFTRCNGGWDSEIMSKFFRIYQKEICELRMHLKDPLLRYGRPIERLNVSNWLKYSKITKLCLSTKMAFRWSLSLRHLPSLKELHVSFGDLNFQPGLRLRLNKLDIFEAKFFMDKTLIPKVYLHNYIDFTDATDVRIIYDKHVDYIQFRLRDFRKVDTLHLEGVTLMDWATAKCTIKSLTISQNNIDQPTHMIIRELTIKSGEVNLYCLPRCVEKLCIYTGEDSISSSHPKNASVLPKLKSLHVQVQSLGSGNPLSFLEFLRKCHKLVNFSIGGKMCNCKKYSILRRVVNIRFEGPALTNYRHFSTVYEQLVLEQVSLEYALEMLSSGLRTNVLVLECNKDIDLDKVAQVISILNAGNFTMYLGRFDWYAHSSGVKSNALKKAGYVDSQAEYYMFVKGRVGRPITRQHFNALKKFEGQ